MRYDRPIVWLGAGFILGTIWNAVKRLGRKHQGLDSSDAPRSSVASAESGPEKIRTRKRWFIPPTNVASGLLLGAVLLVASAKLYSDIVSPSQAPIVPGHAELYVTNPAVTTDLAVDFPMKSDKYGDSQVDIGLNFYNKSGESVRGIVQRTDLHAAALQQILIFVLGAIVVSIRKCCDGGRGGSRGQRLRRAGRGA